MSRPDEPSTDFFITLPLWLVLYIEERVHHYMPLSGVLLDQSGHPTDSMPALFTEELHAERARDRKQPSGVLWKIATPSELSKHLQLFEAKGATSVAIDPYTRDTDRIVLLEISTLRRQILR